MADKWFIARDKKKFGPYSTDQLKQMAVGGQLLPIDMVLEEGTTQWRPASQVQEFFPAIGSAPPPPLPPPLASEPAEWHFTQNGAQAGPVTWTVLRHRAASGQTQPSDMIWKAGMPSWAAASTINDLFPKPSSAPPPLPPSVVPPALPAKVMSNRVSGELHLDGMGGRSSNSDQVEILLDGKKIGTGSLAEGFHLEFEAALGQHSVKLQQVIALKSAFLGSFGKTAGVDKGFPLKLDETGHYTIKFKHSESAWAKIGAFMQQPSLPAEIEVKHTPQVKEVTVVPVAKGEEIAGGVFTAILTERSKAARKKSLVGLWEPVNFTSQWFMFTKDEAMLRGDGFGTKYRWVGDDNIELYADDTDKTAVFNILSLGEFELILKVGEVSGHFKKGVTISEAETQKREVEARQRRAEAAKNFKNVAVGAASILAAGGFAVLCCGVAVAAVASAPSRCCCPWPIRYGHVCANCGLTL